MNVYDKADWATGGRKLPRKVYPTAINILVDNDPDYLTWSARKMIERILRRHELPKYLRHK